MKRICLYLLLFCYSLAVFAAELPKKPKLIVAVVIDQFRYDYLLKFGADYTGGLKQLLEHGAVFDDAHHIHFPTVTASGHSTFLTGATPSISGIVGNDWYDREIRKDVTSVEDDSTRLIGGVPGAIGSSPRRLLVSTLGDEIKMQEGRDDARVIGISIKDRASILPSGHMADAAYWFDNASNHWVTSSFYRETLPGWVKELNDAHPNSRAVGAEWLPLDAKAGDKPYCTMVAGQEGTRFCGTLEATPWGNEMIEEFAERALVAENLGHHSGTDVLTVSFSSNDYVGHAVGPDAPEVRDISRRTDLLLGKLFAEIDSRVGLGNVIVVLTADHGVAPVPEVNQARNMPGGRLSERELERTLEQVLSARYGEGKWIVASASSMLYFDRSLMQKYKVTEAEVDRTAAETIRRMPHIFRVYTAEEMEEGRVANDIVGRALTYSYYGPRCGNVTIVPEPYYMFDAAGTTHGTPFDYDTHVPVIFMGPGLRPGHYYQKIAVNDIAPTLAALAGVDQPSGSIGRVLSELWQ
jgi:predicted AlkP superfamily pyrophosphatase or phosphodiesterase